MKFPIEGFQGEATRTVNAYLALSFDATFLIFCHPVHVFFWKNTHSLAYWVPELNKKTMRKVIGKQQIITGNNLV